MSVSRGKRLLGITLLLVTTILWGTAFVVLKETIEALPTFFVLTLRFLPSGLIIGLIACRRFRHVGRQTVLHGLVLGFMLALAYGTQTIGLRYTTPARNAFITVAYCIMTPFLVWAMYKRRPRSYNLISGVVCLLGLAFISLIGQDGGELHLLGDGLTLSCAIFYALQIIFIDRFVSSGDNPLVLLAIELTLAGALFGLVTLSYELPTLGAAAFAIPAHCWWRLAYLTFACTLLAQLMQIVGQSFTTSSQASIILSFESVFAAITSIALGMERVTVYLIVGFVLVFLAGLVSELHLDPVRFFKYLFSRGHKAEAADTPEDADQAAHLPIEDGEQ